MTGVKVKKVKAHFKFRDEKDKKRSFTIETNMIITDRTMVFIGQKLIDYLRNPKNRRALEAKSIPVRNEGNFCNIYRIADLYKVKWWQLMYVTFEMSRVTSLGVKLKYEGFRLVLVVDASENFPRYIEVELEKRRRFNNLTASKEIERINQLVLMNGRPRGVEHSREGVKILKRIEKEMPFLSWNEKRKIGNKLFEKPKKKREIFLTAYILKYRKEMSQFASETESP